MKLTSAIEVEILILENAQESARQATARMRRRVREAQANLADAENAEVTLENSLRSLREALLLQYRGEGK